MTAPRRVLRALVTVVLFVALALVLVSPRVTEDDPRWDCKVQGNQVCGTETGR